MTEVSKWMSPCVYWTVSLVWPGRRARAVTARQACRGRLERSEAKRETLNLCVHVIHMSYIPVSVFTDMLKTEFSEDVIARDILLQSLNGSSKWSPLPESEVTAPLT